MTAMFEESAESFTSRWRSEAADAHIHPKVENDPLLELETAGIIIHALERTGPYLSKAGPARVIIHALVESVQRADTTETRVEVTGISRAKFQGRIIRSDQQFLVVDAGFKLVVGVLQEHSGHLQGGDFVTFEALPPLHAFVIVDSTRREHDHEV